MDTRSLAIEEALEITHGKPGENLRRKLQELESAGFTHAVVVCGDPAGLSYHALAGVSDGEIFQVQEEVRAYGFGPREIIDLGTLDISDGPDPHHYPR